MINDIPAVSVVRGSDHNMKVIWRDSSVPPEYLDFTNMTLSFFDLSPALVGRVSGTIQVPLEGTLFVHIEGSPPLPLGLHSFRILLSGAGSVTLASKRIYIRVE
jgi:hypothetical protein